MPSLRLGAYLDAAPVRRRLRAALVVCFAGSLAVMWSPSVSRVWNVWAESRAVAPYTQAELDADFKECSSAAPARSNPDDPWDLSTPYDAPYKGHGLYDDVLYPTGTPGSCHRADAAAVNAELRRESLSDVRRAISRPLRSTFLALIVSLAIWIVIPLAERRPGTPSL
jgi:hypothetical protein